MDSLQFICDMYEKIKSMNMSVSSLPSVGTTNHHCKLRSPWCRTVTRPEVTRLQGPSWFGWMDATLKGFDAQGSLQTVKVTPVVHELPNRQKFSRHKMALGKHTIDNCLDTRRSNWSLGLPQESTRPCFCYSQPIIKHLQFFYTQRSKTGRTKTHLS